MQSPRVAAYSTIFAAAAPEVADHPELYDGAYIKPPNVVGDQSPVAMDLARQEAIWTFIENLLDGLNI